MVASLRRTCDTSVLVPALASWHEYHGAARDAVATCDAIPGHVLLETHTVLTRLPAPHRIDGTLVLEALRELSLPIISLSAKGHLHVLDRLVAQAVRGGAVYDGLVAATALEHDHVLCSLDRRAGPTYDAIGVRVALLP